MEISFLYWAGYYTRNYLLIFWVKRSFEKEIFHYFTVVFCGRVILSLPAIDWLGSGMDRIFPGGPFLVICGCFFQRLHFRGLEFALVFAPAGKMFSSFFQDISSQLLYVYILQYHSLPGGACGGSCGFGPKSWGGALGSPVSIGTWSAHGRFR